MAAEDRRHPVQELESVAEGDFEGAEELEVSRFQALLQDRRKLISGMVLAVAATLLPSVSDAAIALSAALTDKVERILLQTAESRPEQDVSTIVSKLDPADDDLAEAERELAIAVEVGVGLSVDDEAVDVDRAVEHVVGARSAAVARLGHPHPVHLHVDADTGDTDLGRGCRRDSAGSVAGLSGVAHRDALRRDDRAAVQLRVRGSRRLLRVDGIPVGRAIDLAEVATFADGLATRRTDADVFALVDRVVDDLVTVSDAEIVDGVRFLAERARLIAEPAGAAAVAARLAGKTRLPAGTRTVAVCSGGNIDAARFRIDFGAAANGRLN